MKEGSDSVKEPNEKYTGMNENDDKDKLIQNLRSVMVAAAEEIQAHWDAHCDKEGYGPANLMHRLKQGLGANYCGYKPGAFLELAEELVDTRKELGEQQEEIEMLKHENEQLHNQLNSIHRKDQVPSEAEIRRWAQDLDFHYEYKSKPEQDFIWHLEEMARWILNYNNGKK